jgi:RNase P protein component
LDIVLLESKTSQRKQKLAVKSAYFYMSPLPKASAASAPKPAEAFVMAVPKRLLKKAVFRNAVKRVCRESWRQCTQNSHAFNSNLQVSQQTLLLKLTSIPLFTSQVELKRLVRQDLDGLLVRLVSLSTQQLGSRA